MYSFFPLFIPYSSLFIGSESSIWFGSYMSFRPFYLNTDITKFHNHLFCISLGGACRGFKGAEFSGREAHENFSLAPNLFSHFYWSTRELTWGAKI